MLEDLFQFNSVNAANRLFICKKIFLKCFRDSWSLVIKSVQESDAGKYICQVSYSVSGQEIRDTTIKLRLIQSNSSKGSTVDHCVLIFEINLRIQNFISIANNFAIVTKFREISYPP
jgi:hypothetical protein